MVNNTHLALKANDRSYFAILKKQVHALARSAHFSEKKLSEIDIIVAEIVSNLVKHAGGGQILVKLIEDTGVQGIEILSIDNGPGMADVTRMLVDGVSTKSTLGQGLGAMKRLADVFQIYSHKDWGTVILVRVFDKELPSFRKPAKIDIKSVIVAKPGEEECGDGLHYTLSSSHLKLFLGDGLGHGPEAAQAIAKAGEAFRDCADCEPVDIIRYMNRVVRKTRGLVGTVAVFDIKMKSWKICGVGNIVTKVFGPTAGKAYMAYNGIIGLNVPNTMNAQVVPYEKGQYIIMTSDGLKSRWDTLKFQNIMRYDLSILSASLLKDFARNTDDMSVVTCKINL